MQEKVKEEFLQARKVVNEAILLDQQSTTSSCLLELLAEFGKGYALPEGLPVLENLYRFRSVQVSCGVGRIQEVNIQLF